MSPMNNDNRKDYQTVLEEQTPLVCNDAVENKSSSTRLATLLGGIAVFAFLAMSGQLVSHANSISELKAALADHRSQYEAQRQDLTVQIAPLLGAALQGSADVGDQYSNGLRCTKDAQCASGYCTSSNPYYKGYCSSKSEIGWTCIQDKACFSGSCSGYGTGRYMHGFCF